eukprot:jgi/Chrzof1/1653/Cz10g16010.t1
MAHIDNSFNEDSEEEYIGEGRLSALLPRKLFQDDAAVKSGLLQVFVRLKPIPSRADTCMTAANDEGRLLKATWKNKEALYKFSKVFLGDSSQSTIYAGAATAMVQDFVAMKQPSAVIMAYGVTSAGKTYTMQGTPDKPGLVPQALKQIFQGVESFKEEGVQVSLSVYEIYNENIHDLLAPTDNRSKPTLKLKEDKQGRMLVVGLNEVNVHSAKEALDLQKRAAKVRQSAGTCANQQSSRSHAVCTIKLQRHANTPQAQQCLLHFVDLAGCERVARTGNAGARLRESVAINTSLMTLARCLEVLRYNQMHPNEQKVIPYRESKITHLFKDVLHGQGRFVMLVNVSQAVQEFNETKRVLQYAALASKITMTSNLAVVNEEQHQNKEGAALGASAAASSEALAAAESRVEELLDEKADLEYDIDVLERKVELLREELVKAEVEKEQMEADIRQEIMADVQGLLNTNQQQHKEAAIKANEDLALAMQQLKQVQAEMQQLQTAHLQLKAELANEQEKHQALQQEMAQLQQANAEYERCNKAAAKAHAAAMKEQKKQYEAQAKKQEKKLLQQLLELKEAQQHIECLTQQLAVRTESAQQKIKAQQEEIQLRDECLKIHDLAAHTAVSKEQELAGQLSDKQADVDTLKEAQARMQDELCSKDQRISDLQTQVAELSDTISSRDAEMSQLQQKLTAASTQAETLTQALHLLPCASMVAGLQYAADEMRRQFDSVCNKLNASRQQVADLEAAQLNAEAAMATYSRQLEQCQQQCEQMRRELEAKEVLLAEQHVLQANQSALAHVVPVLQASLDAYEAAEQSSNQCKLLVAELCQVAVGRYAGCVESCQLLSPSTSDMVRHVLCQQGVNLQQQQQQQQQPTDENDKQATVQHSHAKRRRMVAPAAGNTAPRAAELMNIADTIVPAEGAAPERTYPADGRLQQHTDQQPKRSGRLRRKTMAAQTLRQANDNMSTGMLVSSAIEAAMATKHSSYSSGAVIPQKQMLAPSDPLNTSTAHQPVLTTHSQQLQPPRSSAVPAESPLPAACHQSAQHNSYPPGDATATEIVAAAAEQAATASTAHDNIARAAANSNNPDADIKLTDVQLLTSQELSLQEGDAAQQHTTMVSSSKRRRRCTFAPALTTLTTVDECAAQATTTQPAAPTANSSQSKQVQRVRWQVDEPTEQQPQQPTASRYNSIRHSKRRMTLVLSKTPSAVQQQLEGSQQEQLRRHTSQRVNKATTASDARDTSVPGTDASTSAVAVAADATQPALKQSCTSIEEQDSMHVLLDQAGAPASPLVHQQQGKPTNDDTHPPSLQHTGSVEAATAAAADTADLQEQIEWRAASEVLNELSNQQQQQPCLVHATGRRATMAAGSSRAVLSKGQDGSQAAVRRRRPSWDGSGKLTATAATPVAMRTRHRKPARK